MKTVLSIVENSEGMVVGAMVGSSVEGALEIVLDTEDVCHRSELPEKASELCNKYGLQPSVLMLQALAAAVGSSTPPPPSP